MTNAKLGDVVKVAGHKGIFVVTKIMTIGGERVFSVMNEEGLTIKTSSDTVYKTAHSVESVLGAQAAEMMMESLRGVDEPFFAETTESTTPIWVDDIIRQFHIDSLLERLHMQITKKRAASSIEKTKRQLKNLVDAPVKNS